MRQAIRMGMFLGGFWGLLGVLLALPYLFPEFILATVSHGALSWPLVAINLIPLGGLVLSAGLATRRGVSPRVVSGVVGVLYGLFNGTSHWIFARIMPHKSQVIQALWTGYHLSSSDVPGVVARQALVRMVEHPAFMTMVVSYALEMGVIGFLIGWLGEILSRLRRKSRSGSV